MSEEENGFEQVEMNEAAKNEQAVMKANKLLKEHPQSSGRFSRLTKHLRHEKTPEEQALELEIEEKRKQNEAELSRKAKLTKLDIERIREEGKIERQRVREEARMQAELARASEPTPRVVQRVQSTFEKVKPVYSTTKSGYNFVYSHFQPMTRPKTSTPELVLEEPELENETELPTELPRKTKVIKLVRASEPRKTKVIKLVSEPILPRVQSRDYDFSKTKLDFGFGSSKNPPNLSGGFNKTPTISSGMSELSSKSGLGFRNVSGDVWNKSYGLDFGFRPKARTTVSVPVPVAKNVKIKSVKNAKIKTVKIKLPKVKKVEVLKNPPPQHQNQFLQTRRKAPYW